jgi:hypothetical protein
LQSQVQREKAPSSAHFDSAGVLLLEPIIRRICPRYNSRYPGIGTAKFGRFKFGKTEPSETYEGDYMALETGFVRIFEGDPDAIAKPRLVAAIRLDKDQSVREIKTEANKVPKQSQVEVPTLGQPTGRKFRFSLADKEES